MHQIAQIRARHTPAAAALYSIFAFLAVYGLLILLHWPLLRLPYFWDEAGYYIPAALDFCRHGLLVPKDTLPSGHTPLLSIYLGMIWRIFGFTPLVTRLALIAVATGTLAVLYVLARALTARGSAVWACILLAVSPVFFAQSSLAHLDLPVALTTTAGVYLLLRRRLAGFALVLSLAVLTKETAIIFLPVAWVYAWRFRKDFERSAAFWLALPLVPLAAWAVYYHHATGFWTGNPDYLRYNLYATLTPARIGVTLLRRLYQVLIAGFHWLLVLWAILGYVLSKESRKSARPAWSPKWQLRQRFFFLAAGLAIAYVLMLSFVGGAVLPRYLLPVFPSFYLALLLYVEYLPKVTKPAVLTVTAACFVAAWFINPPYPFPYEDNLSYADFVRLHQQAADFLASRPNAPRILTAWPATNELEDPALGYVSRPLRVVKVQGFTSEDFSNIPRGDFDILYLYSRQWDPPGNWLRRSKRAEFRFEYVPPVPASVLAQEYHLKLLASFERRGQWVKIYSR